jgi:hypothetical protein
VAQNVSSESRDFKASYSAASLAEPRIIESRDQKQLQSTSSSQVDLLMQL